MAIKEKARGTIDLNAVGTTQYFWHDNKGAHVSDAKNSVSGKNLLLTNDGLYIKANSTDVLAKFLAGKLQVGRDGEARITLTPTVIQMIDDDGHSTFKAGKTTLPVWKQIHMHVVTATEASSGTFSYTYDRGSLAEYTEVVTGFEDKIWVEGTDYTRSFAQSNYVLNVLKPCSKGDLIYIYRQINTIEAQALTIGNTDNQVYAYIDEKSFSILNSAYSNNTQVFIGYDGFSNQITLGERRDDELAGEHSVTIGDNMSATQGGAIAIGYGDRAQGFQSLALGYANKTVQDYSIAIGYGNNINNEENRASVSVGFDNKNNGDSTLMDGIGLIAPDDAMYTTLYGYANVEDTNNAYRVIIGNGMPINTFERYQRRNAIAFDDNNEAYFGLDTTATSGQDYSLKTAINSKGWLSSLVSDNMVKIKSLLTNIINNLGGGGTIAIMTGKNSNRAVSFDSTSATKARLENFNSNGSGLSISSGGIKCANGGKVKVSACARFTSVTDGDLTRIDIYKGSSSQAFQAQKAGGNTSNVAISTYLLSVSAGDVIYLYCQNATGSRGSVPVNSCWMTVEYV